MRSLLADLDDPAVDAFLDAVDSVMNSNTFLLKVHADVPVQVGNRVEVLTGFVRGRLFEEMMRTVDRARGWSNLQDDGSFVHDHVRLDVRDLDPAGLRKRLRWMLLESFSPYRKHLSTERADALVEAFSSTVFGAVAGEAVGGWSFCTVRPDFLVSSGYYTDEAPAGPAYFDGGDSDSATYAYRDDVFCLLLTNGSP